ncbi:MULTISPECIES: GhoT/OrtT family toxin [unclassified Brenneria]|uniref:GhoT/OrtT family toxin n=1 Tax=unclassified Brenneria TaxID=2634434 RepID=UPI0029C4EF88|nr:MULTISPECIES: GhoT/OrtT family toxin [unclassified Brenneria]MDX5627346.1 GhoT/OrtT family toxin [Brenneria sp. L3-3Z]MDX5694498.1 GhoT/OrtT family toxin [Brenneria sp. L4-2C]MEE3661878.1 GhoT/OrtT family toxin [Brenneria sp. g21c3]
MPHQTLWESIKLIYVIGFVISLVVTFLLSRDNSLTIRFLTSLLIGVTWPLSFPVVLLFSIF